MFSIHQEQTERNNYFNPSGNKVGLQSIIRFVLIIFFLICAVHDLFADDEILVKSNEPEWIIYMNFNGHHEKFDEYLPAFNHEISQQQISSFTIGEAFSMYFSNNRWGIGCAVEKRINVREPINLIRIASPHMISFVCDDPGFNLSEIYSRMLEYMEEERLKNDGPLLLVKKNKNSGNTEFEVLLPVRKNRVLNSIMTQSFGIFRCVVTFVLALFAYFIFVYRNKVGLSNILLGIFIVILILHNLESFLWIYRINDTWPHLYEFSFPFYFATGPILFFYTVSIIRPGFTMNKWHYANFIPFFLTLVAYFLLYQIHDTETKLAMLRNGFKVDRELKWLGFLMKIHLNFYVIISIITLRQHAASASNQSSDPVYLRLTWIRIVLYGLLVLELAGFIKHQVKVLTGIHSYFLGMMINILEVVFVSILVIRSLRFPEVFALPINGNGKEKYSRSPLREEHKNFYINKLEEYMLIRKPYLRSNLTLPDLSREISVPTRYLSQILNEKKQMNFYDYINLYRLKEVKKMLSDLNHQQKSIIDIAYECGFNSKSVFNASFKKDTGLTPTEFRLERSLNQV